MSGYGTTFYLTLENIIILVPDSYLIIGFTDEFAVSLGYDIHSRHKKQGGVTSYNRESISHIYVLLDSFDWLTVVTLVFPDAIQDY